MTLKPWHKVVDPREDLREGRPLDAAEFAVHLDQVREGRAPVDYRDPSRFLERTYLTKNLTDLAVQVLRRLSGIKTETSAVFNMATQFGGGKTHALTLLYHLVTHGSESHGWKDVGKLVKKAGVDAVPQAKAAVFVGTEFDSITGRGGSDGTPLRKTPWGEIAYQLGGKRALKVVAQHEEQMTAPGGDVIRAFLPKSDPCLILVDELMNYISRSRKSGLGTQVYNFLHDLGETVRGLDNVVLAVSVPASELEMTAEDQGDYERVKKMLDRIGKAVVMSAEAETAEIIRRRLFDWGGLPSEARKVAAEYADWIHQHRQQIPNWFPVDQAKEEFEASYPFHPVALSVFQRKWQALPRFQRTRGILRLLALWVSQAHQENYKGARRDTVIGLGTAPLDDPMFRAAMFEQLGEPRLEGAVTTDICGKRGAHAVRLDEEAVDAIKQARLHRKVSTVIFFESNGGQVKAEATLPEIRLGVSEPDLDIGNVETALEALGNSCYFLIAERNRYRFGLTPNLNKLLADRRASIKAERIDERVKAEIGKAFPTGQGVDVRLFPERSNQLPNRPVLTLVVMAPQDAISSPATMKKIDVLTREHGQSARTFKSALLFSVAADDASLREEARRTLAWEDIRDEDEDRLDERQRSQLSRNLKRAQRDLEECVWRSYNHIALLGEENQIEDKDLGLVHSSQTDSMVRLVLTSLKQEDVVSAGVSPNFLKKHWSGAAVEWSTKAVRDAFFASPKFPRLLDGEVIKDTIAKGVAGKILGYVGKGKGGRYEPFYFGEALSPTDVEISDDMFIIPAEEAQKHIEPPRLASITVSPPAAQLKPGTKQTFAARGLDQHDREMPLGAVSWTATGGTIGADGVFTAGKDEGSFLVTVSAGDVKGTASVAIAKEVQTKPEHKPETGVAGGLTWTGEVPSQKWMNFYRKVLAKYATEESLRLTVSFEVKPEGGVSDQAIDDTKIALRELGLNDDVQTRE